MLSFGERFIPIPDVNPSWWSLSGLLGTIVYLYLEHPVTRFLVVLFTWVTDWYDGATARKYDKVTREGYLVDDVIDRFSEGFIFLADAPHSATARIFFLLWIVNCALTIWSVANHTHRVLPLRFAYLFVLAYWMFA